MMSAARYHMVLVLASAAVLLAEQPDAAAQERDPFFSSGPRSSAKEAPAAGANWGRDPFARPFEGAAAPGPARTTPGTQKSLTGIIYSSDVQIAIIQGEACRVGAQVGDQRVADIRPRSVLLVDSTGKSEEVSLDDFSVRK